ncbi:Pyruvate/Phosphoenolpyruvate kinase [Penicillium cf. griseofulvum]|uniref:Pyruvate/Phosphoenolpyruvate kinase n=1 Tax=Penicillium cf. griseofulvum TaxID=2972120 RepID=A0A9W9J4J9_9EURO|nr:Pyruvate/Phosphoenolpyruvate kinase [Penicillium cf. griseofulvum]KAJ5435368.1 Pyruvate/Phosphoenolpyruvate kinase [Penicillium cf. griseofulvum]KAJ5453200.1 Pyruvate/Phosphoenolpyruvate kinase [Penicillium cf. griseofulvum]
MSTQNDIAKHLRALHQPGNPLILTNVYDAATASIIASLPSAPAIATASYAIAATIGVDDNALTKAQNLTAIAAIAASVRALNPAKPLTVDLQDGYGDTAELADTINQIIALGVVGCNIEDMDATGVLRSVDEAAARVRVVIQAAKAAGVPDFVVNARTDVLLTENGTIEEAIERGKAFLEAGATTVFVWGSGRGVSTEEVAKLVNALGGMVNVKMNLREGFLGVKEIRALGVARVSVGPELWRTAMKAFTEQAEQVLAL